MGQCLIHNQQYDEKTDGFCYVCKENKTSNVIKQNNITLLEQAYKALDYPFSEGMHSLTVARCNINNVIEQIVRDKK